MKLSEIEFLFNPPAIISSRIEFKEESILFFPIYFFDFCGEKCAVSFLKDD